MMPSILMCFLIGMGVAGAAWLAVKMIREWILRHSILDVPNDRSLHSVPTPRGGGVAIVAISLAAWIASLCWTQELQPAVFFGYLVAAILVAAISWTDDVRDVSRLVRFAAHGVAAALVLIACGCVNRIWLPTIGEFSLGWLGIPLTFLWIVGLTNAYNFMDGIDGIAAGQAIVAGIGWLFLGRMLDNPAVAVLGLVIAASSLGFLFHNRPPAKIFMGDVGSAFLGFTFAFLTVWCSQQSPSGPRLAELSVLLVWPFVFDSILTFFRRLSNRENVFAAHRSHLYQRLVQSGMTHGKVSRLYTVLASFGLLPVAAHYGEWKTAASCLAAFLLVPCGGLWVFTAIREARSSSTLERSPDAAP